MPVFGVSTRSSKLENLYDLVRKDRHVLITSPPQSGRYALAELFVDYVQEKHPNMPIYFFSFDGKNDNTFYL